MRKTVKTIIITGIVAAAPAVFAATHNDNAAGSEPTGQMSQMGEMGHGMGMMGDGNMMPTMAMMTQMNDMMETCNKMMQGMMDDSDDAKADTGNG